MRKSFLLISTTLSFLFIVTAFTNDILHKLDLAEAEAKEAILGNFIQADLYFPRTSAIKNFALGKREEAVKELGSYIRRYAESAAFEQQYQQARAAAKPQGPEEGAALVKNRIAEVEAELARTEEEAKKATGDMRKLYEFSIKTMKDELKALKDPADPRHKDFVEQAGDMSGFDAENYKMQVEQFEKNYPPTVQQLVKGRLQQFLNLTQHIDFNAKLVERNGKKVFADPKLEAKDALWKRCFRAGPETINAARKFAQEWLASLP